MLKKTRHRLKRRKRKTRRLRGGSVKNTALEVTDDEKRTNNLVKEVVVDVITELKKGGVLEKGQQGQQGQPGQPAQTTQRQDTFSANRPTGLIEQILLAPVRIPAKLVKLPFKLYKAPFKFVKKLVF